MTSWLVGSSVHLARLMLYESPCDLQVKLVLIIQKTSNNKASFLVVQVWPCHTQIVDWKLTLYHCLKSLDVLSFHYVPLTDFCSLKLCRHDFKNSWWSNGKILFPNKIIYFVHNKFLQINEIKSWISNYGVYFSYIVSRSSSSKKDGIIKLSKKKINDRNIDDIFR